MISLQGGLLFLFIATLCARRLCSMLVKKSATKALKGPSPTTYIPHLYKGYVKTHKCTQNGGVPSHWSSDVLCVSGNG